MCAAFGKVVIGVTERLKMESPRASCTTFGENLCSWKRRSYVENSSIAGIAYSICEPFTKGITKSDPLMHEVNVFIYL